MKLSGYWTYYFAKHQPNSLSNKWPVLSKIQGFLSFVFEWLWILSVSLINRWLCSLIAGSKLKNSLKNWQSLPQNFRDKSFVLRKLTGFVTQFWIFDHILSCFVCSSLHLCLSCSVAQFSSSTWFHCALWSAFGLPRISLFTIFLYPFCPRRNCRRRSLLMLVLSHSDTHTLNRHMA